ncbi:MULTISPECIES: ABC transporter permease [Rhizobium/Agrobacterium group]|uniref:ABC transporter permease n=1 Tax=Agrobacterium vitis TaxID=373 RepID=A0AAE2REY9_AGRVI|nr:ABC transporter permease [Agrobacterium vitis]MCF1449737.1 capsular biosynthesis protein [Allorhizobium ampelinum]MBF2716289.1 ABC transporter permease [Agrobacterium vitis]MCF1462563.1 capsular biosynthesis protein [Allorhizobium ampelinum]MUZ63227.1 capsular biosynthesis protein [Agrobacterium vitis]MVA21125.1 capsular biosynthesis protein [Agrobacterium vitis]
MTEISAQTIKRAEVEPKISVKDALRQKLNVMHAVIMRDIRSRYFNHGLGFLIVPLFPVAHILLLLTVYNVVGKKSEFGDDLQLFFATGLLPVMTFMYVSRFMSISLIANKSMMSFPVVRLLDIVLARAFLEFIGIVISFILIYIYLISTGSNPVPIHPSEALTAFFFTVILSIGFGISASVISAILPIFPMIYGFSMVVVYLTSGAPIYLNSFPEVALRAVSWNPVFHAVEWVRSAYYLGYPTEFIDKQYLIGFSIGSVCFGLVLERLLRRYALEN